MLSIAEDRLDSGERLGLEYLSYCRSADRLPPMMRSVADTLAREGLLMVSGTMVELTDLGRMRLSGQTAAV